MKHITITPHAIISLLVSTTLLVNTAAPALAQVQKTPRFQLTPSQQDYISRQTYTAVTDGIQYYNNQQASLINAMEQFSRGNLTDSQLARLAQIKYMFTPLPENITPESDFEQFKTLYTAQIDKEFTRENNAMKSSMAQMNQKITDTANTYRKEVYESLVHHVTSRVLEAQGNTDKSDVNNLSKHILKDIQLLTYNPQQNLNTQITQLAQKYKNDPQSSQILTQIADQTQTENKYLLREQAVIQWKEQANQQLKAWYEENFALLNNWKKQAYANAQQVFDKEYHPSLLQAREQEVFAAVRDLWAYKDLAPKSKYQFLTLALVILPLRTLDNKSFLNKEQKEWLYEQYIQSLQKNLTCGNDSPHKDACKDAFLAITGLSMLTDSSAAAQAIENFMQAKIKTPYSVPTLLAGTAALLSMKQYNVLGGFLHTATRDEYNIDNIDILSFETLVNLAANINGQYLGAVSKYAQYPLQANPTDQTAVANAWEDLAQLLAIDGSAPALELLRKYGVEQCRVITKTTLSLQKEHKLICAGIIPFLAGALASGKSGAAQYNPIGAHTIPGPYLNHRGTAGYISPEQAQQNARAQASYNQAFHQYAASMGLSNEAMLARHLFLQSMGDLNAESELRLDTQLYEVYAHSNPKPKPGFAITAYTRNSTPYNAKRERQDRTQFWRKAARIGDIAVLVWCLYDVSKWLHSGVKIARAITQAATMARNGATVAQRAMMLRRLNVAPQLRTITTLGTRIKNGMAPSVLAELPHFTTNTVQLPKFEGFVESAGTLVAQNMRFSAQTGLLAADLPALTDAARGVYSTEQLNAFNGLLETAATNANTQFANRSAWKRFFTWNKDASYRSYLKRNLLELKPTPGMTQTDLHNVAFQISRLPIQVPQNIAAFKAPSFLETAGGASQLNMGALTKMMTRIFGATPTPAHISHTEDLLNTALVNTNAQFLNRNWLSRQWSFVRRNQDKKYKDMLLDNLAAEFDKDGKMFTDATQFKLYQEITSWIKADQTLSAPAWTTQFRHFGTVSQGGKFHTMGTTLLAQAGSTPVELPLVVQMQLKRPFRGGIKGVNQSYQRVLISEDKGNLFFGFGNDLSSPVKPSQFKLTLDASDMPALIRAAQGYTGPALEIKLTSPTSSSFFSKRWTALKQASQDGRWNPIPTLFRGKNNIYVHSIPVSIRQADGTLTKLPLTFKADSYLGLRGATAVLEEGGNLTWYRGRHLLQTPKLTYSLPKNQIRPFLGMLRQTDIQNPLHITALSGKNKIEPLMWATGLSLSSASTGLIAPLENVYGDRITEMDKTWISLAFPYVPSLAAPFFSPLVMKIGALRTLQLALGISTVGLGFASINGFQGKVDKNNPPPVWPLFVSGMAIGVSSALSRSGLNLLIDSMGGGGTLLKSMAYKNIGSFALLLPPFIANFIDKDIDFSLAFPVLGALSFGALTWVSASRISTAIGKVDGFMPFEPLKLTRPQMWLPTLSQNTWTALKATGKEAWSTTRLLATKEVLPLVLAATAFTGFEAGAFSKAGNQMIRPIVKNGEMPEWIPETNRNNYTAMLTNLSVITFPLVTRLAAKPVLKFMSNGRVGDEYRHMLQASFTFNATGAGLLYANGFDGFGSLGFLGIGMMGMGTANMTQSFQKLSNISVKSSTYAKMLTRGLSGAAKESMEKSLVTKTMTGFPVQQLGIAIVPTLVSGYTDRQIDEGTIQKSEAPHSSMWIPIASLALCFGLSMPHIGLFPARIPTGLFGFTKGVVGSYPGAIEQLQQPQFYIKEPYFGTPNGFTPLLNNPILNTGSILPNQKVLEKIETKLQRETTTQPQTASFIPEEPVEEPLQEDNATSAPQTHTL